MTVSEGREIILLSAAVPACFTHGLLCAAGCTCVIWLPLVALP
jgi:hypothetical protein